MATIVDLPIELLQRIVALLSPPSYLSCSLAHRTLNDAIKGSINVQYLIRLETAQMLPTIGIDNDASKSERLRLLNEREERWINLKPLFKRTVEVDFYPSSVYDLTSSRYVLSEQDRMALRVLHIPKTPDGPLRWDRIELPEYIMDFGLSVKEHDLIAVATMSMPNFNNFFISTSYKLSFLRFSSGIHHPESNAQEILLRNVVNVRLNEWALPALYIEIAGRICVVVMVDESSYDEVFVIDWLAGTIIHQWQASSRTYRGVIFLSSHLLLLPNVKTNTLEVWDIPLSPTSDSSIPPDMIMRLDLPILKSPYTIRTIQCRCEPNVFGTHQDSVCYACPSEEPTMFDYDPDSAIIAFSVGVKSNTPFFPLNRYSYLLFVPRNKLRDYVETTMADSADSADTRPNEGDAGSSSELPHPSISIPYSSWSISICTLISSDSVETRWITMGSASRVGLFRHLYRALEPSNPGALVEDIGGLRVLDSDDEVDGEEKEIGVSSPTEEHCRPYVLRRRTRGPFSMIDFNPFNVNRIRNRQRQSSHDQLEPLPLTRVHDSSKKVTNLGGDSIFADSEKGRVKNHLHYSEVWPGQEDGSELRSGVESWDGCLVDEHAILGLKTGGNGRVREIDVLYFG